MSSRGTAAAGLRVDQDLRQVNVTSPFVAKRYLVHACRGQMVELHMEETAGCTACCASSVCAAGGVSGRSRHIAVDWQAAPGDRVSLRINSSVLGRIAVMCYLLPAALMLAGAVLAGSIDRFAGDGGALLGAAIGLALGGVVLRLYDSRHGFRAWQVEPARQDSSAQAG